MALKSHRLRTPPSWPTQTKKSEKETTKKYENIKTATDDFSSQNDFENPNQYSTFAPNKFGMNSQGQELQYRNAREYAKVLHCWLWQYRMIAAFSTFQSQMFSSVAQNVTPLQNVGRLPSNLVNGQIPSVPLVQQPHGNNTGPAGVQYKIPMLWRRVVAEFLDFVLLFYTKILVTVAVLRQMGYMNEDILMDLDAPIPFLNDINEFDYEKMFSLTSELIALEIINRVCITLVETLCLRKGYAGSIGGATPGKKIMQLRVVSFTEIRDARNGYVLAVGAADPGFFNALIRSIIKNFSMAFFFPACLTVVFFRFNRTAYDVLAQTIVVEVEHRHPEQAQ